MDGHAPKRSDLCRSRHLVNPAQSRVVRRPRCGSSRAPIVRPAQDVRLVLDPGRAIDSSRAEPAAGRRSAIDGGAGAIHPVRPGCRGRQACSRLLERPRNQAEGAIRAGRHRTDFRVGVRRLWGFCAARLAGAARPPRQAVAPSGAFPIAPGRNGLVEIIFTAASGLGTSLVGSRRKCACIGRALRSAGKPGSGRGS